MSSSELTCAFYPNGVQERNPIVWKTPYSGSCSSFFPDDEIDACYNAKPSGLAQYPRSLYNLTEYFRMDCQPAATGSYQTQHTAELTTHPDGSHELKLSQPLGNGAGLQPVFPANNHPLGQGRGLLPIQPAGKGKTLALSSTSCGCGCSSGSPCSCRSPCPCRQRGPSGLGAGLRRGCPYGCNMPCLHRPGCSTRKYFGY